MGERPKIGEILVSAGIIDEMQLASALGEQARWGRRLGVTLIKMGMVEEEQLIRGLAVQLDLPVASLEGKRIAPEVLALVPARFAAEHGVMPLFIRGEEPQAQLYLGMEDPSDLDAIQNLTFRTGLEIRPVMVGPSEISAAIDRFYHRRRAVVASSAPIASGDALGPASLKALSDEIRPERGAAVKPTATAKPGEQVAVLADSVWELPEEGETDAETDAVIAPSGEGDAPTERSRIALLEAEVARLRNTVSRLESDASRAVSALQQTQRRAAALAQLLVAEGHLSRAAIESHGLSWDAAASEREPEATDHPATC